LIASLTKFGLYLLYNIGQSGFNLLLALIGFVKELSDTKSLEDGAGIFDLMAIVLFRQALGTDECLMVRAIKFGLFRRVLEAHATM